MEEVKLADRTLIITGLALGSSHYLDEQFHNPFNLLISFPTPGALMNHNFNKVFKPLLFLFQIDKTCCFYFAHGCLDRFQITPRSDGVSVAGV